MSEIADKFFHIGDNPFFPGLLGQNSFPVWVATGFLSWLPEMIADFLARLAESELISSLSWLDQSLCFTLAEPGLFDDWWLVTCPELVDHCDQD
jgi:hypothetical protein